MKKRVMVSYITTLAIVLSSITTFAAANTSSSTKSTYSNALSSPIITVGKIVSNPNDTVDVPLFLSQNTGICAAKLTIEYDKALLLTRIEKGNAFTRFSMTTPDGDLKPNPCTLLFDAQDEVDTNGLLATLKFNTPPGDGLYNISVSYSNGDIVNGDPAPVSVVIKNGCISVVSDVTEIAIGDKTLYLPESTETGNRLYVAYYTDEDKMSSLKTYSLNNESITAVADPTASYAKVFYWTNNFAPLCISQLVVL